VYFHLILTDNCNLHCSYCRAKAFEDYENKDDEPEPVEIDPDIPPELDIDLKLLYGFLAKDPTATLTFYGGEPLLKADLIDTIIQTAPVQRFMLQTNALLLDRLAPDIVNRFSTILVSIDGQETLTDTNRGPGVYREAYRYKPWTGGIPGGHTKREMDQRERVCSRADRPDDRNRAYGHC